MVQRLALLLAAALAFAGCEDRRAGTETGNPEITVTADIVVIDYLSTQTLALNFRVMGMSYSLAATAGAPDSGKCWARPGGTLVDFVDWESNPLPDTLIEDKGLWLKAAIILRTPEGPAGIPDGVDIETWSNPRYAKFLKFKDSLIQVDRTVLFEMPPGVEYALRFDDHSTGDWRKESEDEMWIPFRFNASLWADTLTAYPGMKARLDAKGVSYLLLSPTENAAAWNALNARIRECFYADSVIVR